MTTSIVHAVSVAYDDRHSRGDVDMPMIDVYALSGTFSDKRT
jgi:hypothetical protein